MIRSRREKGRVRPGPSIAAAIVAIAAAFVSMPAPSRPAGPASALDAVEVLPKRVLALSAYRSEAESSERSVVLAARGGAPFEILAVESTGDHVVLRVEPLEPGRRYRLIARLRADAQAGQRAETVRVRTSAGEIPILLLTFLKERVWAAPPALDFGLIDREELARLPERAERLPQTFHVYRRGGGELRVRVESTVPSLELRTTPAEGPGVVVDIPGDGPTSIFDVEVVPRIEALASGELTGEILVHTDDQEFPLLRVDVRGTVR